MLATAVVNIAIVIAIAATLLGIAALILVVSLEYLVISTRQDLRSAEAEIKALWDELKRTNAGIPERLKRSPGAMPLTTGEQMAAAHGEADATCSAVRVSPMSPVLKESISRALKGQEPSPHKGIRKVKR